MTPFQRQWADILAQCELERIPRDRIHVLAMTATVEDMRFLLGQSERIGREWNAIRGADAGDVSDDYWRMSLCVSEAFEHMGTSAAVFLLDEIAGSNSAHRARAAALLPAVSRHWNRERLAALLEQEADPEVRNLLTQALEKEQKPRRWWPFRPRK